MRYDIMCFFNNTVLENRNLAVRRARQCSSFFEANVGSSVDFVDNVHKNSAVVIASKPIDLLTRTIFRSMHCRLESLINGLSQHVENNKSKRRQREFIFTA